MSQNHPASSAWSALLQSVASAWPPERWRDLGVVVGCSGGADSVALLSALCEMRQSVESDSTDHRTSAPRGFIVAAHFNHRLRAEESDADEAFVCDLAGRLQVRFIAEASDDESRDEATLRNRRLSFLSNVAKRAGARYVALAHSLDDNVETVLHHLMRGTGPAGLAGIRTHRSIDHDLVLVRPMLAVRRDAIRWALKTIGQPWREDASNLSVEYRRNWIRHELIPLIESKYSSATVAMNRAITAQQQWRETIDRQARVWLDRQVVKRPVMMIDCDPTTDRAIVIAGLQLLWREQNWPRGEMDQNHWLRLAETLRGSTQETDRYTVAGGIDVSSDGKTVRVCRVGATS